MRGKRTLARVRNAAARKDVSTSERDEAIAAAYADGWTLRAIAAEAGLAPETVRKIVMRAREA